MDILPCELQARDCCPECVYLGEGDFACMAGEGPKIVMSDFFPTDNYGVCPK